MKKLIFGLLLVVGITTVLSSCKKEETYGIVVPSKSILVAMPGQTGTTTFESFNIASISVTSTPKGWNVDNIDLYSSTITVTAPSTFEDEEVRSGNLSLKGYTPQGTTKSFTVFLAIVEDEVDYSDAPANCYIANKAETRYIFDACTGGNDIKLATEKVQVIWQTEKNMIKYLDIHDGKAIFYLENAAKDGEEPKVAEGNALIGGFDADGEQLWSWHIWITNNDPTAETITLGGATMMNQNLGAATNSNASKDGDEIFHSFGMYYQWGCKNPLVGPDTYNFAGNHDYRMYGNGEKYVYLAYKESSAEMGTLEWLSLNPTVIIKGRKENGYDWLYNGHDNTLWDESAKTNNDPCPAGWRVPAKSVFEKLTIATSYDDMSWEEAQPLYGWMLTDTETSAEYFFTAQGRRNYLDGRLDIINDDEICPVPWSGYYWTASTDGDDASAMFFDLNTATRTWNGFDAARKMHRANAMPVRCVRE